METNGFTMHSIESAPEGSKATLEKAKANFGMIPGLAQVLASSPAALKSYFMLTEQFQSTSLTPTERNVVWLAINVEHNCHYCVPAHTGIAKSQGVDDDVIEALRNAEPLADAKLEALRTFTLEVVRGRGEVSDDKVKAFLDAGYDRTTILDIIVGVAHKVMSNYINHFADTPVDEGFKAFAWDPK